MSVGAINIANRGFVFNNSFGSVNLFPWVHYVAIQRGSLAAVRYSMAFNLFVYYDSQQIKTEIRDADLEEREVVERPPNYFVYFDFQLNPVYFDRSTQYSSRANELFKQKRIKTLPDVAYFQNFFKEFIYLKKPQVQ